MLVAVLSSVYLFILIYVLVVPLVRLLLALRGLFRCRGSQEAAGGSPEAAGDSDEVDDKDLEGYVLTLEGEGDAKAISKRWKNYPERNWISSGRDRRRKRLLSLLKSPYSSPLARSGLARILIDGVQETASDDDHLLQGSWSLRLATLACIVRAAFHRDNGSKKLTEAIYEGFEYWMLVDKNYVKASNKVLKAARMVQVRLVVQGKWLDERLENIPGRTASRVILRLRDRATRYVKRCEATGQWPLEEIAAKSMSRVTRAMLQVEIGDSFGELEAAVMGVIEECLAGLSLAIGHECSQGSYGSREEHVRPAAQMFGETQEILELLEERNHQSNLETTTVPRVQETSNKPEQNALVKGLCIEVSES